MTAVSVYLDANATTPLDSRIREGMKSLLEDDSLGNPSSLHGPGRRSRKVIEEAREHLAKFLDVDPLELFFTSGGTESNNIAITALARNFNALWVTSIEHPSIREPARTLWKNGFPGGEIAVEADGQVKTLPEENLDGALVSIQWVNNETGTIQNLQALCHELHRRGAVVHTDGAQGFFRLPQTIPQLSVDLATVTAHKSFGPQGVGALWMRRGLLAAPLFHGGSQERKVRPGTENVSAIHGIGMLARISSEELLWPPADLVRKAELLHKRFRHSPGCSILSRAQDSFPSCLSITFDGIVAETLLVRLDMEGIFASSGSACSSGAREPSHVLAALGCSDRAIRGAIRLSFTPETSDEALIHASSRMIAIAEELRSRHADTPPTL